MLLSGVVELFADRTRHLRSVKQLMSVWAEGCLWALGFYGHRRQVVPVLRTKDKLQQSKEQRHRKTNYPSLLTETLEGDAATFKQAVNTYIKLNPKERELCEGSGSEEMLL